MTEFKEKRAYQRLKIECDIHCHRNQYIGRCRTLSGAGVSFTTTKKFNIGESHDIIINPNQAFSPSMKTEITIVRLVSLNNDAFEIGASINRLNQR